MQKQEAYIDIIIEWAFQVGLLVKNLPANAEDARDTGSIPRLGRSPGGRMATHPVFLPHRQESHGQRRLTGCSSWGHEEPDTTEAT